MPGRPPSPDGRRILSLNSRFSRSLSLTFSFSYALSDLSLSARSDVCE
jgi:hypothetical protein